MSWDLNQNLDCCDGSLNKNQQRTPAPSPFGAFFLSSFPSHLFHLFWAFSFLSAERLHTFPALFYLPLVFPEEFRTIGLMVLGLSQNNKTFSCVPDFFKITEYQT